MIDDTVLFLAEHGMPTQRRRCAIDTARRERLNQGLRTLALWVQKRAEGTHNTETTLTVIARKVAELQQSVDKAGWAAKE